MSDTTNRIARLIKEQKVYTRKKLKRIGFHCDLLTIRTGPPLKVYNIGVSLGPRRLSALQFVFKLYNEILFKIGRCVTRLLVLIV